MADSVPPEAYEAAAKAYDEALNRMLNTGRPGRVLGAKGRDDLAANDCFRASVDAVWSLGVAEGRRQAAEAIRERADDIATRAEALAGFPPGAADDHPVTMGFELAARIAEGGP